MLPQAPGSRYCNSICCSAHTAHGQLLLTYACSLKLFETQEEQSFGRRKGMSCRPRPREKLSWEEAGGCWEAAPPQESQLRLERDQKYSSSPGPDMTAVALTAVTWPHQAWGAASSPGKLSASTS